LGTKTTTAMGLGTGPVVAIVLGKMDGKVRRFSSERAVPEGVEPTTDATLEAASKEQVAELYALVAGVLPKGFRDKETALSSLRYQVSKMPFADRPGQSVGLPASGAAKPAKAAKGARKGAETYELLTPSNFAELAADLPPQARELVGIMVDLAKERGATKFTGVDLQARLNEPASVARLKTKQEPIRILTYYEGRMIGAGLLRVG
jgi:hypothetical protein